MTQQIRRRALLGGLASSAALSACSKSVPDSTPALAEPTVEGILKHVQAPSFPDRSFDIRDYGAQPDTEADNSEAIAKAIAACHAAGGGRVLVSGGRYPCGPIHLESNINLHIEEGATLAFATDPQRYLPPVFTRWEGVEHMGYSPLIYAYKKTNIAITGKGQLDGQANPTTWWAWKGNKEWGVEGYPSQKPARTEMFEKAEQGVLPEERIYADGAYLRPPFVQPYLCENVLIEDVHIVRAPFWLLNPVLCQNVTVRGVRLESLGPNSDGCDPESCKNVLIEDCYFDTGDDCIAIKSGRNNDGRRVNVASENIVIRNCKMRAGHGGVVIGSEISGGVRNVIAENNVMSSPDLERGFRIKTNSVRGGLLENLFFRNNTIGTVQDAIVINFYYEEGDAGEFNPTVRNVRVENIVCEKAERVFQVRGFNDAPIQDLQLRNCTFVEANDIGTIENVDRFVADNVMINGQTFKV